MNKVFDLNKHPVPDGMLAPEFTPELRKQTEACVEALRAAGFDVCLALNLPDPDKQVPTYVVGNGTHIIKRLARTIHAIQAELTPRSVLIKSFRSRA